MPLALGVRAPRGEAGAELAAQAADLPVVGRDDPRQSGQRLGEHALGLDVAPLLVEVQGEQPAGPRQDPLVGPRHGAVTRHAVAEESLDLRGLTARAQEAHDALLRRPRPRPIGELQRLPQDREGAIVLARALEGQGQREQGRVAAAAGRLHGALRHGHGAGRVLHVLGLRVEQEQGEPVDEHRIDVGGRHGAVVGGDGPARHRSGLVHPPLSHQRAHEALEGPDRLPAGLAQHLRPQVDDAPEDPLGFLGLALTAALATLGLVQAAFSAVQRAFTRPARETLFTVVRRADKYPSKAFIDTFVYRSGDVVGAGVEGVLGRLGTGLAALISVSVRLAVAWGALGVWLGRRQERLAELRSVPTRAGAEPALPLQPPPELS